MSTGRIFYFLLAAGIALCLLQICFPAFYVTGDGPCHVYNAAILKGIAAGNSFYDNFFQLNFKPNPNWMSSLLLSGFLCFFGAATAEKLFLSLYALTMAGGLLLLLRKVNRELTMWPLVIFVFIFHHTLSKGFYNFSLATALFPYMLWAWLAYIDKKSIVNTFAFFFFSLAVFFTQLLPYVLGVVTCGMLVLSHTLSGAQRDVHRPVIFLGKNLLALGVLTSPFLLLIYWFTAAGGGLQMNLHPHFYPLRELVEFKYLVCTSSGEKIYASVIGLTMLSLLLVALGRRIYTKKFHKYDGFLFSLFLVMVLYVLVPEKFMGRDILMTMRLQLFIFMLGALVVSYAASENVKNAGGGVVFLCFLGLFYARFGCQIAAGNKAEECTLMAKELKPRSVVLPLCFAPDGRKQSGAAIAERNYIFNHIADYLGCSDNIILLDNYEALTGYFPLLWQYKANPYAHLSTFEGIEGLPPSADISRYEQVSGCEVRYIIRLFYNKSWLGKGHYQHLADQITAGYHLVKTSRSGAVELFERNTLRSEQTPG